MKQAFSEIAIAIAIVSFAGTVSAEEPAFSAKSLFLGTDGQVLSVPSGAQAKAPGSARTGTAASKTNDFGASYFVRLKNADGSTRNVVATRAFHSGERFQLGVRVNRPSYVYIFNEDANGKLVQLHPQPGDQVRLEAMGVVYLPSRGSFEFDVEPGIEQLTVVLTRSPRKIDINSVRALQPDLISDPSRALALAGCGQPPEASLDGQLISGAAPGYQPKGIVTRSDGATCSAESTYTAKGIFFAEDLTPPAGEQEASYVVKPVGSEQDALTLRLKLLHR